MSLIVNYQVLLKVQLRHIFCLCIKLETSDKRDVNLTNKDIILSSLNLLYLTQVLGNV